MDFSTFDGGQVTVDEGVWNAFRAELRGPVITPTDGDYDAQRARVERHDRSAARSHRAVRRFRRRRRRRALRARARPPRVGPRRRTQRGWQGRGGRRADGRPVGDAGGPRRPGLATVRVAGGCLWSDVDRETQAFGLATTGGTVSHTGVGGLTLGGGIGWLAPLHGLTCDNLVSVDLVTATGDYLHVSEREHPDLFWALRGGGGNFGVATTFELRVHPLGPMVYGGPILWPAAQSREILPAYVELCQDLPDELSLFAGLIPSPEDMQPLVAIVTGWFGPLDGAEAALAPVRALSPLVDMAGPIPYVGLQSMLEAAVPHGIPRYWKSGYFHDFPARCSQRWPRPTTGRRRRMSVELFFHQHGAATRVGATDTAFPHRSPSWDFDVIAQWFEPDQADGAIEWARDLWDEIAPASTGVYVNHLDADDGRRVAQAYGPNYERLVSLKQKYDPDNFFRLNNNIVPPDGSAWPCFLAEPRCGSSLALPSPRTSPPTAFGHRYRAAVRRGRALLLLVPLALVAAACATRQDALVVAPGPRPSPGTTGPPSARVPTTPAPTALRPVTTTPAATTTDPPTTTTAAAPRTDVLSDPARVGQPWSTTVQGLLTFRGNPTRTWYGTGPLPAAPKILWQYPSQAMCGASREYGETRTWCGTGWAGQPAVFERGGRTWVVFGAYDYKIHFVDAATGQDILPPFPTGDIAKGMVTVDPDGYPLVYEGSRDNKLPRPRHRPAAGHQLWALDAHDPRLQPPSGTTTGTAAADPRRPPRDRRREQPLPRHQAQPLLRARRHRAGRPAARVQRALVGRRPPGQPPRPADIGRELGQRPRRHGVLLELRRPAAGLGHQRAAHRQPAEPADPHVPLLDRRRHRCLGRVRQRRLPLRRPRSGIVTTPGASRSASS